MHVDVYHAARFRTHFTHCFRDTAVRLIDRSETSKPNIHIGASSVCCAVQSCAVLNVLKLFGAREPANRKDRAGEGGRKEKARSREGEVLPGRGALRARETADR